ncbi:MAG: hypothetical protein AAFP87_20410 [Pseudomonadota bacterium]
MIPANSTTVENCTEDCPCQTVHIVLHDGDGPFSEITLNPDLARKMAASMMEAADIADARRQRRAGRLS